MSDRSNVRRLVVFVCLAALLLAALTPGTAGLPLALLVVTVCFFVGLAPVAPLPLAAEDPYAGQTLALTSFSPRPPPAR